MLWQYAYRYQLHRNDYSLHEVEIYLLKSTSGYESEIYHLQHYDEHGITGKTQFLYHNLVHNLQVEISQSSRQTCLQLGLQCIHHLQLSHVVSDFQTNELGEYICADLYQSPFLPINNLILHI